MRKYTFREIEEITGGRQIAGSPDAEIDGVSFDSREVKAGELFVPVVGEVHDAHKFIPGAAERGCSCFLVSDAAAVNGLECSAVLVEDTTAGILKLAKHYLDSLSLKKVAVTGSIGKTSTRDMVYAVLKEKYNTGCSKKNYNTEVGVAMTIFSFDESMEAAVLETGMDCLGEISRLVNIIRPDVGIITYVGTSHIERLGSRENIFKAKMEITDFFGENNTLVINGDNDMLAEIRDDREYAVIKAGSGEDAQYRVSDVKDFGEDGIEYTLTADGKSHLIRLNVPGAHNALNSALAVAAGVQLGVSAEEAVAGLCKIELTGRRLKIREKGGMKVIDDTYNASPESMMSAVTTLVNTKGKRKIAVLGGINELGDMSERGHHDVGVFAAGQPIDFLYTVSEPAEAIARGFVDGGGDPERVRHYDTKADFFKEMDGMFSDGDVILIKASRGRELEEIVEKILED
ncbi:MAG: UDP-N-acetylmuramoyl-tripeptide--D-alanyl-D-alanine ligase [Firmicutes bacterium]|nr:UDP-N-acetylmuramoyl-tripeptide--D-alanyl-D-alanine ligase [Bacillota bacterium]